MTAAGLPPENRTHRHHGQGLQSPGSLLRLSPGHYPCCTEDSVLKSLDSLLLWLSGDDPLRLDRGQGVLIKSEVEEMCDISMIHKC